MNDTKNASSVEGVEGEGSYTATRRYNADLTKAMRAGRSRELAEAARKALDGPGGASLREAERIGKEGHPTLK